MLKKLLAASLLVISQSFAAEPTVKAEWSLWEVSLTRTDMSGKTLSQAKAPLALDPDGCFNTQLVINMGTSAAPCLWTVECMLGGPGGKLLNFEVDDTNRTISWINDGDSSTRTAELFDVETSWHGAGRYLVFTMDGETLTADIHPVTDTKIDYGDSAKSTVIVVTRRDRSRNILSQTTAPWPAASDGGESSQLLAIQFGTKDAPQTRLIRCNADLRTQTFNVEALLPITKELGGTQVRRLFLLQTRSPINAAGKYLIQELDGETLETEVRPAGKG
jgi:hypothetical protein